MKPNRVYGVDFSGAINAGRKIWIAGGEVTDGALQLELCQPAAKLPNSGSRLERALAALRTFVSRQAPCVVGLDFPFGLPQILVEEERWEDFALSFGKRYSDPDAFKASCTNTALARTECKELWRATDIEVDTPMSPYNLWTYKMTYYGIRDVLAPLVGSRAVSVLPMQQAVLGCTWLIEICPASTLDLMGLSQSYKHRGLGTVRDTILTEITTPLGIVVPDWVRDKVTNDNEGDALDSIIAAVATFRALRDSIAVGGPDEPLLVEGRVYV